MGTMFFLSALLIAITAVIYRRFLSREEILSWWFQWGDRNFSRKWFYKPIWGCEFCIAGQMAAWTYMFNWIFAVILKPGAPISSLVFVVIPEYRFSDWSVFSVSIYVCLTILLVGVINYLYNKIGLE